MRWVASMLLAAAASVSFSATARCADDAATEPELKTAAAVGVKYYLALPKGWSADKTWPIVVTIDGAGHNFPANCQMFARVRGGRPFIIVTPCVTSNGRTPADLAAVLEIVDEVRQSARGQPKFFITGFSAGGHLTWQL